MTLYLSDWETFLDGLAVGFILGIAIAGLCLLAGGGR